MRRIINGLYMPAFEFWYNSRLVVIEMLKFHKDREMMFTKMYPANERITTFKYTMANSFDYFQKIKGNSLILDVFHHLETLKTDKMPWDLKKDGWNNEVKCRIFDYSKFEDKRQWAFDVDNKNILQAYKEAKGIEKYMRRKFKCKTSIVFSGSKGFHVDTDLYGPAAKVRKEYYKISKRLMRHYPSMDKYVHGRRRAWRTPYSMHGKTGLVCFPLGEREKAMLEDGHLEQFLLAMRPKSVFYEVRLLNRGYAW